MILPEIDDEIGIIKKRTCVNSHAFVDVIENDRRKWSSQLTYETERDRLMSNARKKDR
jgi:hypothetical protein